MNKKKIIAIAAIIALVILSFFTGSTFAKYLTEYKTSAYLQIARWSVSENFLVNGVSKTSKTINLATTYEIKFDNILGAKIHNLVFMYNNNTYSDFSELSNALSGTIAADSNDKIVNLEIGWSWPYETLISGNSTIGDNQDTSDGSTIYNSKYSFDITITCTQDIPQV